MGVGVLIGACVRKLYSHLRELEEIVSSAHRGLGIVMVPTRPIEKLYHSWGISTQK